ncbi:MAG: hypothetical protein RIA65_17105 [Woeseia sp.]
MSSQNLKPDEAQVSLASIEAMQRAGFGRAAPPRWYGAGLSLIVAIGFALYAMEDPGNGPGLFLILAMALFIGASREKISAIGKEMPDSKAGVWALAGIVVFLLTLFFGGIVIRRAYDIAWVPLLTGFIAGATIFVLSESERRDYQMKKTAELR